MSGPGLPGLACPAGLGEPAPDLSGKVVLLVGAGGGLGQVLARKLSAAGAEVVLLGRRVALLERLFDAIEAEGGKAAIYPFNLAGAGPDDYAQLAATLHEKCGGLDALVFASAHLRGLSPVDHTPPDDWLTALHVNLGAPFLLAQACLPLLRERPGSALLFTVNGPQTVARAYWGGYGVAQAGLAQLAAVLADELEQGPVRVFALDPGPMRTPLRQKVWFSEDPSAVPSPEAAATAITGLLGPQGAALAGHLLRLHDA
ncbi:MAG: SDR family NAD(P)-dependent oxidoreductase [Xanthomonadales bacterium]|nr:SDR family NAD(P)-dependent oxidoreductase [Xanthomonadales bacterium]